MKANLIFFLTLIIFSSTYSTRFNSKETSMEFIISELVELNTLGGKDKVSNQVLVENIRSGINDLIKATDGAFGGIISRCENGDKLLNAFIKKLSGDVEADKARILQAQDKSKKALDSQKKYHAELTKTQESIHNKRGRIAQETANYHNLDAESEEKIDVVKRLSDIIADELLAKEGKLPTPENLKKAQQEAHHHHHGKNSTNHTHHRGSFVQISDTIEELKTKLGEVQDIFVTPLVSTLLSIASQRRFGDQDILKKILALLAKIHDNLLSFRKNQRKNFVEILKQIKNQLKALIKEHRGTFKLYHESQADVKFYQRYITYQNENVARLGRHIESKRAELGHWEKMCIHQRKFYNNLKDDGKSSVEAVNALSKVLA